MKLPLWLGVVIVAGAGFLSYVKTLDVWKTVFVVVIVGALYSILSEMQ